MRAAYRAAKQFACNAPVNSLIAQHARQQKYGGPLQVARDEEWPANTATLRGHTGSVKSVAVVRGPGGHGLIASGSEDKTIRWAGHNTVELGTEVLDSLLTSTSEGALWFVAVFLRDGLSMACAAQKRNAKLRSLLSSLPLRPCLRQSRIKPATEPCMPCDRIHNSTDLDGVAGSRGAHHDGAQSSGG